MRVTLSWLEEFVPLGIAAEDADSVAELTATLADLGFVAESVKQVEPQAPGVVLAKVQEITAIPGADRIRRVVVDIGEAVEVVCGAWNFSVGDVVPLALPGVVLPGSQEPMQRRKMRGVVSNGMLCSGAEVGLAEDAAGLLIVPPGHGLVGQEVSSLRGLGRDVVFDLEVQANRPDGNSVVGIARDLAARLGLPFNPGGSSAVLSAMASGVSLHRGPSGAAELPAESEGVWVRSEDAEACPRLLARAIGKLKVGPSLPYVARRLGLCGMRPLNSVVDASNYVMLELGQPTHPYDMARLGGAGLVARRARQGESIKTIDGSSRELCPPGTQEPPCVIADASGEVVSVAGVMGGASSEISIETTEVLLEAAHFSALAVARSSRRMGLRTEASLRYEKSCDPWVLEAAIARICELLAESGSSHDGPLVGVTNMARQGSPVPLRQARASALLGTALADGEVERLLVPMGFSIGKGGRPGSVDVEVPTWRPDVTREVDLIEEIARQRGYSSIAPRFRRAEQVGGLTPRQRFRRRLGLTLVSLGALECWTPTIVGSGSQDGLGTKPVEVANPLVKEESALRTSLLSGLSAAAARNLARGVGRLRLFEIGRVFGVGEEESVKERETAALLVIGEEDVAAQAVLAWRSIEAALGLQRCRLARTEAPGMHPGRCAELRAPDGSPLGVVGEMDPDLAEKLLGVPRRAGWLELDLDRLWASPRRAEQVVAPSRFPSAEFDLAFTVSEEVAAYEVEEVLAAAAGSALESLSLFDVYRGAAVEAGERSLAWHLRFAEQDHTLTDAEVSSYRQTCVEAVEAAGMGRLRS